MTTTASDAGSDSRRPMVTVVMPVYNMRNYVAEALRSVLATVYPRLEVIVVDDGSLDDSYAVAAQIAAQDHRVRVYRKANGGASSARNYAIERARGTLILPVDADNTIEAQLVERAVDVLTARDEVKVVAPTSDYFGGKTGVMRLHAFSLRYLARENCIDNCAMYRRADWQRVGGYNVEITTREDWAFWIALLKDGGEVVRLPEVLHHYRVRNDSKRVTQRCNKRRVVDALNRLHPEFFRRMLGGELHLSRSTSRFQNAIGQLLHPERITIAAGYESFRYEIEALSQYFRFGSGTPIAGDDGVERRLLRWKQLTVTAEKRLTPPPRDAEAEASTLLGTCRRASFAGRTEYYRAFVAAE